MLFVATSDGSKSSTNNVSGGHCRTHNMKLKFRICMNNTGGYFVEKSKKKRCIHGSGCFKRLRSNKRMEEIPNTNVVLFIAPGGIRINIQIGGY